MVAESEAMWAVVHRGKRGRTRSSGLQKGDGGANGL